MNDKTSEDLLYKVECGKKLINKKSIFGFKYICILNIIFIILCIVSCFVGKFIINLLENVNLNLTMPDDITTIIITLSIVSISVFQIIIEKIDHRIIGMSYKRLFFKDTIWRYRNFPNSTFILLEMMMLSIIFNIIKNNVYINIIQCIILAITIYFSFWVFYLSLIAVIKKSKIYYLIKKKITNKFLIGEDNIIAAIINKLPSLEHNEIKYCHNSYIYEEVGVLIYLIIAMEQCDNVKNDYRDYKIKIINAIKNIIINDDREVEYLKYNIKFKGDEEFGIQNKSWIEVWRQLEKWKIKISFIG